MQDDRGRGALAVIIIIIIIIIIIGVRKVCCRRRGILLKTATLFAAVISIPSLSLSPLRSVTALLS